MYIIYNIYNKYYIYIYEPKNKWERMILGQLGINVYKVMSHSSFVYDLLSYINIIQSGSKCMVHNSYVFR